MPFQVKRLFELAEAGVSSSRQLLRSAEDMEQTITSGIIIKILLLYI